MAIYNSDGKATSSIETLINEKLVPIIAVYKLHRGKVRTLWELVEGYIYTSDSYALTTSDGYVIKCNDQ